MHKSKRYTVYLDSWMINVGIIGFLNILLTDKEKDGIISNQNTTELSFRDNRILLSNNKLEFENDVLAENGNFAERFFKEAFLRYGRYNRYINRLKQLKEIIKSYIEIKDETKKKKLKDKISNEWAYKGSYQLLEKKYKKHFKREFKLNNKLNDKSFNEQSLKNLIWDIDNCLTVLNYKPYFIEFFENDVHFYLSNYFANNKSGIKKQSGFLNVSVKGSKEKHFFKNIVEPIILNNIDFDKKYKCIIENAPAKKKSTYNSGLIPFLGNPGAENYYWLDSPNELPLSEIYELLYWCTFAGFTDITKGNNIQFLFCNQDTSVVELWSANKKLSHEFSKDIDNTLSYINFLTNLILTEKKKSSYELQNTVLIDIQNVKDFYTKIYSLYISREKASFLVNERIIEKLTSLAKIKFSDKGFSKSLGIAVLNRILKDNLNYEFLYYLSKEALSNNGNVFIQGQLQNVNYLILKYIHSFQKEGGIYMNIKECHDIYEHGKKVAVIIKRRNDENKIRGIVHKFLGYQKTGDLNSFMNLFMRIHMAYALPTPSEILKSFGSNTDFNAFGYSFINGLLNINNEGGEKYE